MEQRWESVETASQDGTEFLGWSEVSGYHVVVSHQFDLPSGKHAWFNGDVYVTITHWMPLPEPPLDKKDI
jgi:hypothetical protein